MTLAERIFNEKFQSINFNSNAFLEDVEKFFKSAPVNAHLFIDLNSSMKESFRSNLTNADNWLPMYRTCSIAINPALRDKVFSMLKENGFYLFKLDNNCYCITIQDMSFIEVGYRTAYKIR